MVGYSFRFIVWLRDLVILYRFYEQRRRVITFDPPCYSSTSMLLSANVHYGEEVTRAKALVMARYRHQLHHHKPATRHFQLASRGVPHRSTLRCVTATVASVVFTLTSTPTSRATQSSQNCTFSLHMWSSFHFVLDQVPLRFSPLVLAFAAAFPDFVLVTQPSIHANWLAE
ncbi:unnamed protein product [Taenia asiatica]|uniref:Secreted protein n=1 Tax=Taenia asiatica TaxID=60517 RepID=A0A0R3WDD7_TAEAS|nr:unnamed protein product [Taenia asiatica]